MEIRQSNAGKKNISLRRTRSRPMAGAGIRTAGLRKGQKGNPTFVRKMIKNREMRISAYLMSDRAWLEQSVIDGMTREQRAVWKSLSPSEQQRIFDQVEKTVVRTMKRYYKDEKIRDNASGDLGHLEKYQNIQKVKTRTGRVYHETGQYLNQEQAGNINTEILGQGQSRAVLPGQQKQKISQTLPIVKAVSKERRLILRENACTGHAEVSVKGWQSVIRQASAVSRNPFFHQSLHGSDDEETYTGVLVSEPIHQPAPGVVRKETIQSDPNQFLAQTMIRFRVAPKKKRMLVKQAVQTGCAEVPVKGWQTVTKLSAANVCQVENKTVPVRQTAQIGHAEVPVKGWQSIAKQTSDVPQKPSSYQSLHGRNDEEIHTGDWKSEQIYKPAPGLVRKETIQSAPTQFLAQTVIRFKAAPKKKRMFVKQAVQTGRAEVPGKDWQSATKLSAANVWQRELWKSDREETGGKPGSNAGQTGMIPLVKAVRINHRTENLPRQKKSLPVKPVEETRFQEAEKEYRKYFGNKLKRAKIQHEKLFRKEFNRQFLDLVRSKTNQKEARTQTEKELSMEELQIRQLKETSGVVLMPFYVYLKTKTRQAVMSVVAKVAAAAVSFVSAVASMLLPLFGVLAAFLLMINFVFGVISYFADDSSAGLPDAAYVKKEAVMWAKYIADADEKHGYNDGYFSRWGPNDYSSCTFVITAFDKTGLELKRAGATKITKMYDVLLDNGFMDVTESISLSDGTGLEKGDVLIKIAENISDCRAEIADGDGYMTGAISDERGKQKGGTKGDQTGTEICTENYKNLGWTYVLRYYGDTTLLGGIGTELAEFACSFVGKFPYVYGGTSLETGTDCSGFVYAVYAHYGYSLPRTAGNIYLSSRKLSNDMSTWQPGDIIYYSATGAVQTGGGKSEHIGIYIGNGKVVQCGNGGVSIKDDYNYNGHFYGAGRILPDDDGTSSLTGNNNAQKIWNYLRKTMGCSRAAAAGIIGNMFGEVTTFDPAAVEGNGIGHGICQWSWDRWYGQNGLQAYAVKNSKSWDDLALQLSFFRYEIDNHIVSGIDACIPGGFEAYKRMTQVSGSGGTVHLWFNAYEYNGGTFSYDWLLDTGEQNWKFKSHRLAFAISCYNDTVNYP